MGRPKTLDDLSDFPAKPARPRRRWLRRLLVGLGMVLLAAAILAGSVAGLVVMVFWDSGPTIRTIDGPASAQQVAHLLVFWELFGPPVNRQPEYSSIRRALADRMRGVRGASESGGWNGDGSDWYEVDLAPDLAAEIRTKLAQSSRIKQATYFPDRNPYTPDWWPTGWPPGAICYEHQLVYLILTPDGTTVWVKVIRT